MPVEHSDVLVKLKAAQDVETDNRQLVKEADQFLNLRGGQWEESVTDHWDKRPRYTFDHCNPVVDSIMGDMEETDFAIDVIPAGGGTSKKTAENLAGMVRNMESISAARFVYNQAAKVMSGTGLAGWRVVTDYRDSDSFQQDLLIKPVNNFTERVWYDPGAVMPTMEDADECWLLTDMAVDDYKRDFPEGSGNSVSQNINGNSLWYKKESVVIGEWLYKVEKERELALLSNNQIVVIDDDFDKVRDEMFNKGIAVAQTRKRKFRVVHQRLFDGSDWLTDKHETVFEFLPIIPVFANFGIHENKLIYWGAVEKLMDPQRVLNYAESKKIAETALKPIEKTWVTTDQAKPAQVKQSLETQNVNNEPVQLYKHMDGQPVPFKPQANQPDMVLIETAKSSSEYIDKASNLYDPSKGVGLSGQSGDTIRLLQNKGSTSNFKYIKAMEVALTHTARIVIKAIPKVYDTQQELRVQNADGTYDTFVSGERIKDEQSGEFVEINNLGQGQYDVAYKSGPAYYTKQQETVNTILQAGQIDPSVIQMSGDILFGNIPSPGMDKVAERKRRQLFEAGALPKAQLTKEEIAEVEESKKQPPQMSPTDEANLGIAQAEIKKADAITADTQSKMQERQDKTQLELKKMFLDNQKTMMEMQSKREDKMMKFMQMQTERLNKQADTLNKLKDAMGAEAIISPKGIGTYDDQLGIVHEAQTEQ